MSTEMKPHHLKLTVGTPTSYGFGIGTVELDGHKLHTVHCVNIVATQDDWCYVTLTLGGVSVEANVPDQLFGDVNLLFQRAKPVDDKTVVLAHALTAAVEHYQRHRHTALRKDSADTIEAYDMMLKAQAELQHHLKSTVELHDQETRFPVAVAARGPLVKP